MTRQQIQKRGTEITEYGKHVLRGPSEINRSEIRRVLAGLDEFIAKRGRGKNVKAKPTKQGSIVSADSDTTTI